MVRFLIVVSTLHCLLILEGCYGHLEVRPRTDEQSAIAFGQRMIKEMSTGMDRLLSPLHSKIKNETGYRVFTGTAAVQSDETIMENFAKFCSSLGATMKQNVCQSKTVDDDVRFVVQYTSSPEPQGEATAWQRVSVYLTVFEPVGKASANFWLFGRSSG